eukprot:CAMPEP_0184479954 /NCGR_PEP_ID=MMETSP0113_2-20130426/1469_1 /TAXON_ID=91329 /ORGANISM="Norrisiella sphaerica, Strain BC52" /LENGTH=727 /DNA_ID=CAMNT_0026858131 /DNA_START=112 /DNA_END=2292 /DNA_ORIENTATION=-
MSVDVKGVPGFPWSAERCLELISVPESEEHKKVAFKEHKALEETWPLNPEERKMDKRLKNEYTTLDIDQRHNLIRGYQSFTEAELLASAADLESWNKKFGNDILYSPVTEKDRIFHTGYREMFHGTDKWGHPVSSLDFSTFDYEKLSKVLKDPDELVRIQSRKLLAAAYLKYRISKVTCHRIRKNIYIMNLGGLSLFSFYRHKDIVKGIMDVGLKYFPETMLKVYLVNPSRVFYVVWKIAKIWLDKATLQKIFVLKTPKDALPLWKEDGIDVDQLPKSLGGRGQTESMNISSLMEKIITVSQEDARRQRTKVEKRNIPLHVPSIPSPSTTMATPMTSMANATAKFGKGTTEQSEIEGSDDADVDDERLLESVSGGARQNSQIVVSRPNKTHRNPSNKPSAEHFALEQVEEEKSEQMELDKLPIEAQVEDRVDEMESDVPEPKAEAETSNGFRAFGAFGAMEAYAISPRLVHRNSEAYVQASKEMRNEVAVGCSSSIFEQKEDKEQIRNKIYDLSDDDADADSERHLPKKVEKDNNGNTQNVHLKLPYEQERAVSSTLENVSITTSSASPSAYTDPSEGLTREYSERGNYRPRSERIRFDPAHDSDEIPARSSDEIQFDHEKAAISGPKLSSEPTDILGSPPKSPNAPRRVKVDDGSKTTRAGFFACVGGSGKAQEPQQRLPISNMDKLHTANTVGLHEGRPEMQGFATSNTRLKLQIENTRSSRRSW